MKLEREGRVVGFNGPLARVRVDSDAACGSCGSRSRCGSGAARIVELELPASLAVGDRVDLSLPAASVTRAALLGYLLPALCLIGGALLGAVQGNDTSAALGALGGLAAGLAAVRLISHSASARRMGLPGAAGYSGECS